MTRQFTSLRKTFDDGSREIETSFMQGAPSWMPFQPAGAPGVDAEAVRQGRSR